VENDRNLIQGTNTTFSGGSVETYSVSVESLIGKLPNTKQGHHHVNQLAGFRGLQFQTNVTIAYLPL
jgi:hypothetical protein